MSSDRLRFALDQGALVLPDDGRIALFGAPPDAALPVADAGRVAVISGFYPDVAAWQARGVAVTQAPEGDYAAAVVTLPRARDLAEARLAAAAAAAPLLVVDGAKTCGVESLLKAVKARAEVMGVVSKAHGKCFWLRPGHALDGWARPAMTRNAAGDWTAPGVFSADGPDPGTEALAAALPRGLKGAVADLGAGWGGLAPAVLAHPGVTVLHLVEADHAALACARANVTDPRARFHWDDATAWRAPEPLDAIVMNPPFHTGRKADPALGRAFIDAAARLLAPQGTLWMVANRHLPYEATLTEGFREVEEIGGDARFKLLRAARPSRRRR